MNEAIKTIITYTIACEKLREEFTDYLKSQCRAIPEVDQSTYVSPLDKEDILLKLQIKPFPFGKEDHVTLYYCVDKTKACLNLSIDRLPYKEKNTSSHNTSTINNNEK